MPATDSGEFTRTAAPSGTLLLTGATLGFVVVQLDVTIVNVALQRIGASLGGNISGLQWIVNAYTLVFAALILTTGALGDRLGARRVYIGGFAIFALASLACGLSTRIILLVASRAVQGLGAAILVPCSLALINHNFPEHADRDHAISIWAAGASVALAGGPVVGGFLIAAVGWRTIFLVNIPLALVGIALIWRYSSETTRLPDRSLDLPGQFLAIFALADLAATMIEGGSTLGWRNPFTLGGFALFLAACAAFLRVESRSHEPMLPLPIFRNPTFSAATLIGWIINVVFYGLIFVLSLFFQRTRKYSPLDTGLAFLPMTAIVLAANLISGRITTRMGARLPMLIGQLLMIAGCLMLLPVNASMPYARLAGQLLLIGAGIGLTVPAMTSALLGTVEKPQSGIASGVLNAARQAGSVVGVALFGTFIGGGHQMVSGLRITLLISAVILLPGSLLTLRIRPREQHQ
ncbi:MAG TPA: MFS transporter [Bryobacteraceae bacterium]|jgi:DHA2 family methylenomycin A resistance protein-like MFS transporter